MGDRPVHQITFADVSPANIEDLKQLNRVIFPVNYNNQVYKDMLACGPVTQLAYLSGSDAPAGAIGCRLENTPQVN